MGFFGMIENILREAEKWFYMGLALCEIGFWFFLGWCLVILAYIIPLLDLRIAIFESL